MMTQHACAGEAALDLLLALRCDNQMMGALFSPATRSAFRVGAPGEAEFGIVGRSARAIEFYVERQVNALVLVPGYCERQLRINGIYATGPLALPERFVVELGAIVVFGRLYARHVASVRKEPRSCIEVVPASGLPEGCFDVAASNSEAAREKLQSRSNGVTREQAETREIAVIRRAPPLPCGLNTAITDHRKCAEQSGYEPTVIVPNMTVVLGASPVLEPSQQKSPLVAQQFAATGTQLVSSAHVLHLPPTSAMHSDACSNVGHASSFASFAPSAAHKAEPLSPSQTAISVRDAAQVPFVARAVAASSPAAEKEQPELASKSSSGVVSAEELRHNLPKSQTARENKSADNGAAALAMGPVSGRRWQAETRAYSASDVPLVSLPAGSIPAAKLPTVEAPATVPRIRPKPKPSFLSLIGDWARKRPIGVFALATTSGLLLALMAALIWRSELLHQKKGEAIVSVTTKVSASSVASVLESSASGAAAEAEKIQPKAPENTAAEQAPRSGQTERTNRDATTGSADAPGGYDATAIDHLLSGRHNDALRAYEKQIERVPSDEVSKAIARILRMKLSSECNNKERAPSGGANCPEILP